MFNETIKFIREKCFMCFSWNEIYWKLEVEQKKATTKRELPVYNILTLKNVFSCWISLANWD